MDRTLNPAYLQARTRLEVVLDAYDFRLASELHHHEAFGSAYAEYARRGGRIRLVWEGRESWLRVVAAPAPVAAIAPAPEAWQDVDARTGHSVVSLRDPDTIHARIQTLADALTDFLAAPPP